MSDVAGQTMTDEVSAEESGLSLSRVLEAASAVVSSAEPEVVFESLVHRSARLVCDAATATVSRLDGRIYATTWPAGPLNHRPSPESVVTDFHAPASGDYAGYHGLVSFRFPRGTEGGEYIARLLVERALAAVERERLVEAAAIRSAAADRLERALTSSREVGIAIGILRERHELSDDEAIDLLSRVSQHRSCEVETIASEVARTGAIATPHSVSFAEPGTAFRRLSSVPNPGRG